MKIAFLGKGGSGKSTLATGLVRHLHTQGMIVLAIDADYNMDLSYNLGATPSVFLGTDPDMIKEHVGVERSDTYRNALIRAKESSHAFRLSPADSYTSSLSQELEPRLRLITAGPHTDRVRSQVSCSHSLAAPLKVYLPLLKLSPNEAVVIDERAGTDPVATGILSGVDLAVIVREPTVNSARVAEQIRDELKLAGIAHLIVENKKSGLEMDIAACCERIGLLMKGGLHADRIPHQQN
jgi:CO dehydrogenase maturation factor